MLTTHHTRYTYNTNTYYAQYSPHSKHSIEKKFIQMKHIYYYNNCVYIKKIKTR